MSTYTVYLSEICPPEFIGIGYGTYQLLSFAIALFVPNIFNNNAGDRVFAYGAAICALIVFINLSFCYFYLIETHGLEKKQIYLKLRGLKEEEPEDGIAKDIKPLTKL